MCRVWRYGAALALVGIGASARYDVAEGLAERNRESLQSAAPAFSTLSDEWAHVIPSAVEQPTVTQEISGAEETVLKLGAIGVAGLGSLILVAGGKRIIFTPTHHPRLPRT